MRKWIPTLVAGLLAATLVLSGCFGKKSTTPVQPPPAPGGQTTPTTPPVTKPTGNGTVVPTTPGGGTTQPPAPATAPGRDPVTGQNYRRITAAEQGEAMDLVAAYFDALKRNDFAAVAQTWSSVRMQGASTPAGAKSGITAVNSLDFQNWQSTDMEELRFNITVNLAIGKDGGTAFGDGENLRAVRLIRENGKWKIDAMASGPPWPAVDTSGISNGDDASLPAPPAPEAPLNDITTPEGAVNAYFQLTGAGDFTNAYGLIHARAKQPNPSVQEPELRAAFLVQKNAPQLAKVVSTRPLPDPDGYKFGSCMCFLPGTVEVRIQLTSGTERTLHVAKDQFGQYNLYWSVGNGLE